jgi:RHS repeat-associated protein
VQTCAGCNYMDMEYRYPTNGTNNGRIGQSKDWVTGEEVTYTYDKLQRLTKAETTDSAWGDAYTYDGFGNLTAKTPTKGSAPAMSQAFDPTTNRPYGVTYDNNGNPAYSGQNFPLTWDVENRMVMEVDTYQQLYTYMNYDPWGKRAAKIAVTSAYQGTWEFYFYGIAGQRLGTVGCNYQNGSPVCAMENPAIYFAGKLVKASASVQLTDRLGSVRWGGNTASSYFPYGEERTSTADAREKFGTYVRDGLGQDYADQRYYGSVQGRFWSPDPSSGSRPGDPGSWNKYADVGGDPVNFNDPAGTDECYVGGPVPCTVTATAVDPAWQGPVQPVPVFSIPMDLSWHPPYSSCIGGIWLNGLCSTPAMVAVAAATPKNPPRYQSNPCAEPTRGIGFGWVVGASGSVGLGYGAAGTISIGGGTFLGNGRPTLGTFASGGGSLSPTGSLGNTPANNSGLGNVAVGASAGAGAGVFATTAGNSTALEGQFTTVIVAAGPVAFELDYANGVFVISASAAKSTGYPLGATVIQTNTFMTSCH